MVVPLSTMSAWQTEFESWAPDMNVIPYTGSSRSREIIREFELENSSWELTFNVLLTSYEIVSKEKTYFQEVEWSNLVVDEGHR